MNTDLTREQITNDSDKAMNVLGVPGRLTHRTRKEGREEECWFKQRWVSESRPVRGYGTNGRMTVKIRFDDELHNRHNSFAITADVYTDESRRQKDIAAGGCMHDEIAAVFPELAPLIKWHLFDSDGPMHYIANTVYFASNRDHRGKLAGEACAWDEAIQFGDNPILHRVKKSFWAWLQEHRSGYDGEFDFEIIQYDHDERGVPGKYQFAPKFTFGGYAQKWHECPFATQIEALAFLKALKTCKPQFVTTPTMYSEGKVRELDNARSAACWPEATDEQLCLPKEELTALLLARAPQLVADFRADIERIGFLWSPADLPKIIGNAEV